MMTANAPAGALRARPRPRPRAGEASRMLGCRAGAQWRERCNFCRCGADGATRICTRVICSREELRQLQMQKGARGGRKKERARLRPRLGRKRKPSGPCTPGDETKYQCNTCTCNAAGSGFACTRQLCPPREKRSTECEPGKQYPSSDGCNTCVCTDTKVLACTLKACLAKIPSP